MIDLYRLDTPCKRLLERDHDHTKKAEQTENVISDVWASELGWNSYFVGTRYNKGLGSRPEHHG